MHKNNKHQRHWQKLRNRLVIVLTVQIADMGGSI